jgi:sulfofructose kinase
VSTGTGASTSAGRRPVRVACVGHASLDHVFEVDAFPAAPTKTPAHHYRRLGGGMSFNAAIAAARLGAAVRMLGRVGDDAAAAFLRERLAAEGIEARGLATVRGSETSVSAIVVNAQGERQIFNHRGDAISRAHALDTRQLAGADVVLVDPRWVAGAETALRWCRKHGVMSILDADVAPRADLQRLVPLAQWAVFSEAGLQSWRPGANASSTLPMVCKAGCAVAMVTCGEHGSWRSEGAAAVHQSAPRVVATDTTAAGDVFHGALAVALAEGASHEDAVQFASAAAAFKCERGAGALGAPRRPELARWLREREG